MTTPLSPEPLPAYRRDPETDSVRSAGSAAPSYTSETPTYNSTRRQPPVSSSARPAAQSTGLPAPRYAPGFHRRPHGSVPIVESSWASVRSSHAARQYHAVASRRVSGPSSSPAKPSSGSASPVPRTATAGSAGLQVEEIISPLEDPHLVGEVAAAQARSARLHREACARGEEALNNEGKVRRLTTFFLTTIPAVCCLMSC